MKRIVHDWSSGELVEYEIEAEPIEISEPKDDASEPS